MRIKKELPQFSKDKALLVVTGNQEAKFFLAAAGVINETRAFMIPRSKYSDREGFFKVSGKGKVFKAGAICEADKEKIKQDFLKEFQKHFKEFLFQNQITKLYLFSPSGLIDEVKRKIPKTIQERIEFLFVGNFFHQHPFKLLEKIKLEKEKEIGRKRVIPIKEEAMKILKKKEVS